MRDRVRPQSHTKQAGLLPAVSHSTWVEAKELGLMRLQISLRSWPTHRRQSLAFQLLHLLVLQLRLAMDEGRQLQVTLVKEILEYLSGSGCSCLLQAIARVSPSCCRLRMGHFLDDFDLLRRF